MTDIDFFLKALDLKDETRAWIDLFNIEKDESVAAHSWSAAFLCLLYNPKTEVDIPKALKMAILHDLGEAEIGDIANTVDEEQRKISSQKKQQLEREVWEKYRRKLPDIFVDLWQEYEDQETATSQFVKDMDLIDLCLQALKYEKYSRYDPESLKDIPYKDFTQIFTNSLTYSQTELGENILQELKSKYIQEKEKQSQLDKNLKIAYKALNLKDEKRTGPQLYSIEDPETVAGHSWSTALLTLIYGQEKDLDMDKSLKMALIHDLAEAETGDLPTRAKQNDLNHDKEEKERLEEDFWQTYLPDTELVKLWEEYEERENKEAIFVKEMDLIELCLTALKYERQERYDPKNIQDMPYQNMDEFFETAEPELRTETGEQLFQEIKKRYEEAKT